MLVGWSDTVWIAFINVVLGGLMAIALKWLDRRSERRAKATSDKVDNATDKVEKTIEKVDRAIERVAEVDTKVEEVKKATDGMTTKLVAAGKIEATHEERDRAAAALETEAAKEAEIVRRVAALQTQETIATTNGPEHSATDVEANVKVIKADVKAVKRDVKDVKTEVTREVKEGVKQGIADAEHRADRELDK